MSNETIKILYKMEPKGGGMAVYVYGKEPNRRCGERKGWYIVQAGDKHGSYNVGIERTLAKAMAVANAEYKKLLKEGSK